MSARSRVLSCLPTSTRPRTSNPIHVDIKASRLQFLSNLIAPCSMGTLGRIASGHSQKLIERTADVMLKEKRRLIIVPRETPLNQIHLENMLKLSRMNVDIVPAMPAFYQRPQTVDDMVNFVVGKVLDLVRVDHRLFERWGN